MSGADEHELHPLVDALLAAIVIDEQAPAESAIPAQALASVERQLKVLREERPYHELVGLWARFSDAGLGRAATQLLAVAKAGLQPLALERAMVKAVDGVKAQKVAGRSATAPAAEAPKLEMGLQLRKPKKR